MLQAWTILLILMLSTRPLTAFPLNGRSRFSNSARVPDTGNGSLVDVHIQVSGDVVSITDTRSSIQTIKDAVPASVSLPHPSSSMTLSTKLQNALVSSPTPTPSPSARSSSDDSGSLIFASNSTEAFVTDFKGDYTVPPAVATFSVGTMITQHSGSNSHSSSPAADSGSATIESGAQISPGPSAITDGTPAPTNSASLLIPRGNLCYYWVQIVLVLVWSHALLSFV